MVIVACGMPGPALGHVKSGPQRSASVPQVKGWSTPLTVGQKANVQRRGRSGNLGHPEVQVGQSGAAK